MSDHTEPTVEDLQRENLRAMTDDHLEREYAAVAAQPESDAQTTYLGYLTAEFKHRGKKVPE